MKSKQTAPKNIDEYIEAFPEATPDTRSGGARSTGNSLGANVIMRSGRMTGKFIAQPHVDAMRGMPLFTRRVLIIDQNLIDEISHRIERWTASLRHFARSRNGVLNGLSHHPPMHTELPGDAGGNIDRCFSITLAVVSSE